jgi:hypothetical protein
VNFEACHGTIQKASVVRRRKIYAGSEMGKFFILRPHADRVEVLSEVEMPISDQGLVSRRCPRPSSPAVVARSRLLRSTDGLYAIGPKQTKTAP